MSGDAVKAAVVDDQPTVLVVDFGAQYAQLIARRVREARVYSEIVPHTITAAELAARNPAAIIFSGGPKSVRIDDAPVIDPAVYDLGVPILGICYGQQLIAQQLGGEVGGGGAGEHGRPIVHRIDVTDSSLLTADLPHDQTVLMSHCDAMQRPPDGFVATAGSE
ncbi:MAG TPA: gamma-glutamyl-gamma-aminobutyrate hydrolase family protein, partial [Microthrixaceae bacterium]|nr:gamma-glutamyl-gamma-aminobutyrate hydrolase family protein [Microthrixaceae bacterium]